MCWQFFCNSLQIRFIFLASDYVFTLSFLMILRLLHFFLLIIHFGQLILCLSKKVPYLCKFKYFSFFTLKFVLHMCLSQSSFTGKRHHNYGNVFKGKYLIETNLQFQKFSLLSSWWECGTWSEIWYWRSRWEFYTWINRQQEEKGTRPGLGPWKYKEHYQWHTSSNNAMLPNPFK